MLDLKLKEILEHPVDGAVAIVTQGIGEPHVVNTWNSYVNVSGEGRLLIPVGNMKQTQANIERNNKVQLTIANREVQGKMYKGTGFLIKGTGKFEESGSDYDMMKDKFPWQRAVLAITIETTEQTL